MGAFLEQPIAVASAQAPTWLQALQSSGLAAWQQATWPSRHTEAWKYTSLKPLRDDYLFADWEGAQASGEIEERLHVLSKPVAGTCSLVFIDGVFRTELSSDGLPEEISLCRFSEASRDQSQRIQEHLNSALSQDEHLFAALNTATLRDGVFIDIPSDYSGDAVIEVISIAGAQQSPVVSNQRLLVLAGANSKATVIERFLSAGDTSASFATGVTELFVSENASLKHFRIHEESGSDIHIGSVHTRLARDATLDSFHLALGSDLKRLDLVVHHDAPGAHAGITGIYLPRGREHIDYHTTIEHAVPHCTTDEVFRGIIGDNATAVFNGRIHIHQDAQKTLAELSNRNLLTSNHAQINTKPELEIYADDVRCAHGATVAQLDKAALHYLQARGVARRDAEMMLSFGFINELIDSVELETLREQLRLLVTERYFKPSKNSQESQQKSQQK
ncbi:MAG: Fe-S cluster assembly protein SufD [Pseudomonadota bacterium]